MITSELRILELCSMVICMFQRSLTSLELTEVTPVSVITPAAEPPPVVTKEDDVEPVPEESITSSSMHTSVYRQGVRREASREIINVLEKFSMVTKFARDTTAHLFGESRFLGNSEMDLDRAPMRLVLLAHSWRC